MTVAYQRIGMTEPWSSSDPVHGVQEPDVHRGNIRHEGAAHLLTAREAMEAYDGPRWPWLVGAR